MAHTYASRWGKDRSRTCYHPRREDRRKRAQALLVERATRTTEQQWFHLDELLSVGCGATKERKRLFKMLPAVDQLMAITESIDSADQKVRTEPTNV